MFPTCSRVFEELLNELFTSGHCENESVYLISYITRWDAKQEILKQLLDQLDLSSVETWEGKKQLIVQGSKIVFSQYLEDAKKEPRRVTFSNLSNVFSIAALTCSKACEEEILPINQKHKLPSHLSEKMMDLAREMGKQVIEPVVSNHIRKLGGWSRFNYAQSLVVDAIEKTEKRKAPADRCVLLFACGVGGYLVYYFFFK
jgi:hypothetical protein